MTLNWSINQARGQLTFGKLIPITGNAYEIQLSGRVEGKTYTFYVMDESAEKCLAKSETNATTGAITIAFDQADLRTEFAQAWHEIRNFHTVVSDGTSTLAEGDLPIAWNPVWTEPSTGEAYSMRGPQGVGIMGTEYVTKDDDGNMIYNFVLTDFNRVQFKTPIGPQGPSGNINYVKNETTELFHKVKIISNRYGEYLVDVDPNGIPEEDVPKGYFSVLVEGNQTVGGTKTFTYSPVVPNPTNGTDAANKQFVEDLIDNYTNPVYEETLYVGNVRTKPVVSETLYLVV